MLLQINFQDVVTFQIASNFGVPSLWPSLVFIGRNTFNILKGFFLVEGGGTEYTDRAKLIDSYALVVVLQSI